jgi:hypothetical protein
MPLLPTAPRPGTLRLEEDAVEQVTGALREQIQQASQRILGLYVSLAGSLQRPLPTQEARRAFARGSARIIAAIAFEGQDALWELVRRALALGAEETGLQTVLTEANAQRQQVQAWVTQLVTTLRDRIGATLASAQALSQQLQQGTEAEAMSVVAKLNQAANVAERDVRWSVNAAYNSGVREATDEAGVPRIWVAETDACLHCLAYAGEVAEPRQPYRDGLTFYIGPEGEPKPLRHLPGSIWGPPLHPNCRCGQEPMLGSEGYPVMPWETRETTISDALKREARRSVLRGESGSDSQPALIRAAAALLAVGGGGLPKTVRERARRAVKAGRFHR